MDWQTKISIVSLSLIMAVTQLTNAQYSPQDYVDAHTAPRAEVGAPPLVWNETLAAYAQKYSDERSKDCAMEHSGGPYGENLAAGSWELSAKEAVDIWYGEKKFYDVKSNTCINGEACMHYTQVVWRDSLRVGCGKARCVDGWTLITCNYDPPGNFVGERPY